MAKGNKIMTSLLMNIEANSATLKKGLDDAKSKIGNFSKQAGSQLKGLGNSMKGMLGGILAPITGMFGGLVTQIGGIAKSIYTMVIPAFGAMGAAFAATGIGAIIIAIVAAFGAVYTWIKRTVGGAEKWSLVMAYIGGVVDSILDTVGMIGEFIWDIVSGSGEALKNWEKSAAEQKTMAEAAEMMVALQKRENELWRQKFLYVDGIKDGTLKEKSALMLISDLEVVVAKQRTIANDSAFSYLERLDAINKAIKITKVLEDGKIAIAREDFLIAKKRAKQLVNDKAAWEDVNNLYTSLNQKLAGRAAATRMMLKKQESLTNQVAKEKKKQGEINKLLKERLNIKLNIQALDATIMFNEMEKKGVDSDAVPFLPTGDEVKKAVAERIEANKEALAEYSQETSAAAQSANNLIREVAIKGLIEFGETLGNVISGIEGGLASGFDAIILIMLDFSAQFGKILIAQGVAAMGLKQLIKNPATAIAAGVALIALSKIGQNAMQKKADKQQEALAGKQNAAGGKPTSVFDTMNERGSEMFSLGNGMFIHNNLDTKRMLNGASGGSQFVAVLKGEDIYFQQKEVNRRFANSR